MSPTKKFCKITKIFSDPEEWHITIPAKEKGAPGTTYRITHLGPIPRKNLNLIRKEAPILYVHIRKSLASENLIAWISPFHAGDKLKFDVECTVEEIDYDRWFKEEFGDDPKNIVNRYIEQLNNLDLAKGSNK